MDPFAEEELDVEAAPIRDRERIVEEAYNYWTDEVLWAAEQKFWKDVCPWG